MKHYIYNNQEWEGAVQLSNTGKLIFLSKEECAEDLILPRKDNFDLNIHELVQTFNDKEWRKMLEEKIKECKQEISKIFSKKLDYEQQACNSFKNYNDQEKAKTIAVELFIDSPISYQQKKILWYNKLLYNSKQVTGSNGETDLKVLIERAKQVPISNFIDIPHSNFIQCIFHKEKTASMKYNREKNRVHCFGACGTSHDVIDVVQQIRGCDFKQAIQILTN